MAKSVEELSKQFEVMKKQFAGFQNMMQNSLDSLNAMGSWQTSANKAFGELREQAVNAMSSLDAVTKRVDLAATRMDSLEARLTMALVPAPQVLQAPSPRLVDLNLAPGSSSSSPAKDGEQPMGPGEHYGRFLGPRLQDINKGTLPNPNPPPFISIEDDCPSNCRSPPFPKMEFPKFDGSFLCSWYDQCEVFFEVYVTHPSLKTRFATLNFKGVALTWFQTV